MHKWESLGATGTAVSSSTTHRSTCRLQTWLHDTFGSRDCQCKLMLRVLSNKLPTSRLMVLTIDKQ